MEKFKLSEEEDINKQMMMALGIAEENAEKEIVKYRETKDKFEPYFVLMQVFASQIKISIDIDRKERLKNLYRLIAEQGLLSFLNENSSKELMTLSKLVEIVKLDELEDIQKQLQEIENKIKNQQ